MISEAVADVVAQALLASRIPLAPLQVATVLRGGISEETAQLVLEAMRRSGRVEVWAGHYLLAGSEASMLRNLLVRSEYQQLGMDVLVVSTPHRGVPYIPPSAEHRFFRVAPSTLGRAAGLGLFLRESRLLRQGTILCEYSGNVMASLPDGLEWGPYMVRLRDVNGYVDGVSESGDHLCLATFINDNGPRGANAEMRELSVAPGRVFVVALRDIHPGEEIFCTYGSSYWGCSSYTELTQLAGAARGRRAKKGDAAAARYDGVHRSWCGVDEAWAPCTRCGEAVSKRLRGLHRRSCGDALAVCKLRCLNSLPMNDFTMVPSEQRASRYQRMKALRTAMFFVDLSDPQTFALSHEDVVGNLEFTWES